MPGQSPGPQIHRDRQEMSQPGEEKCLDQQLWQACAGSMVHLPPVGSRIVYFPQGHAEQAQSSPEFPRSLPPSGTLFCRLLSVKFLADRETDEVFAKMRLQPEPPPGSFDGGGEEADPGAASPVAEKPTSFAKTLTQSDANNGGGFSVPRYCAETIFPKLDYSVDPPVQTVFAKDVHGEVWKFRHIYRGTPRRHLLTTGWSTFVNQKKLVAGDAIVFLRTSSGELCVGVRRSIRGGAGNAADAMLWHTSSRAASSSRWELRPHHQESAGNYAGDGESSPAAAGSRGGSGGSSFVRNRPKVSAKSVLDAAVLAASGKAFEVVYYPRASTAEFCVRTSTVRNSLSHAWYTGMRFKMAFETEDSSRISWFMGTISTIQPADCVQWPKSPWRVLQVAWDEPDLLQGVGRVSPWQVELVSTLPMQLPPFSLPRKKFRASQPVFGVEGQPQQGYPVMPPSSPAAIAGAAAGVTGGGVLGGQMNPWHGLSDETPAGMQGARHERLYGLTFSDYSRPNNNTNNRLHSGLLENTTATATTTTTNTTTSASTNSYVYQQQQQNPGVGVVVDDATGLSYGATDLRLGMQVDSVQMNTNFNNNHHHLNTNNSSQNDSSASSDNRHGGGGGTITLFGKRIEMSLAPAPPELQQNSASSSETLQQPCASSSGESLSNEAANGTANGSDIGSLKWFKKQASVLSSEEKDKMEGNSEDVQCKVFLESEEVGRTLELPSLSSYEELYERLATMFSVDKGQLSGRVVYQDLEGSTIHVGGEPYANFMKSVRRLTILADNSSDANNNNNSNAV